MSTSELERAVSFTLANDVAGADRVEPWEHGSALLSPSLPELWDANYLRLERAGELDVDELVAEAERLLGRAGASHRAVLVPDAAEGERLRPGFDALGWHADRLLLMVLRGTPRRRPGAPDVEEVDLAELAELKRALSLSEPAGSPAVARQIVARQERVLRETPMRWFAARANGRLAASCALIERDGIAEIDDVATLPVHRGRGLGRALVTAATAAARGEAAELVFLGAYLDDWPHRWYRRLGFEPVGMIMRFRRVGGSP